MIIGVDFTTFDDIHQGSKSRIIELYKRIVEKDDLNKFIFFLKNTKSLISSYPILQSKNVKIVKFKNTKRKYIFDFPYFIQKYDIDIFHSQYIIPFNAKCKTLVTIHDVLFEDYPIYFSKFFVFRSKLLFRYAAKNASHIVTVSEYSKSRIQKHYGVPNSDITVIYNGSGKYNLKELVEPREYFLSVGRLDRRKNYESLIHAFQKLNTQKRLIIVGQGDESYKNKLLNIDRTDRIDILCNISDFKLSELYRNSFAFIYPTLAEGFGMPLIEAMESGTPTVCSNTTSLIEVGGDATLYIDPLNINTITEKMKMLLEDDILRKSLINKGFKNVKKFDWDVSAMQLMRLYSEL